MTWPPVLMDEPNDLYILGDELADGTMSFESPGSYTLTDPKIVMPNGQIVPVNMEVHALYPTDIIGVYP